MGGAIEFGAESWLYDGGKIFLMEEWRGADGAGVGFIGRLGLSHEKVRIVLILLRVSNSLEGDRI